MSVNRAIINYPIVLTLLLAGSFAAISLLGFSWSLWVNQGVFLLLALFFGWQSRANWREAFRFNKVSLSLCLLSFVIGVGLWWGGISITVWAMRAVDALFGPMPDPGFTFGALDQLLIMIALVLLAPICEEILFRGYFLRAFDGETLRPWLWSGLLFGLMHVGNGVSQVVGATLYGLVFGYMVWRSNSLLPGIIAHIGVNFNAVFMGGLTQVALHQQSYPFWLLPASAVGIGIFLVSSLFFLRRCSAPADQAVAPRAPWGRLQWLALIASVLILLGLGVADIAGRLMAPPAWEHSKFSAQEFTGDMRFAEIEVTEIPALLLFTYSITSAELDVQLRVVDPQGKIVWMEDYVSRDLTLQKFVPEELVLDKVGTWTITLVGSGRDTVFEAKWKIEKPEASDTP